MVAQTRRNVKLHVGMYLTRRVLVPMVQLHPMLGLNIDYQLKSSRFVLPFNAGITSLEIITKGETTGIENFTRNN
jgi:hypothetical protein